MLTERKAGSFLALLPGIALELMIPWLGRLVLLFGMADERRQLLGLA